MSNVLPRSIAPALSSARLAPHALSLLRIAAGLMFLEHGTGKLLGFPAGLPFIDKMPTGLLYFTGTMELVGGVLIVLGLFTRPVAFILSGFMAAAYHGALPGELLPRDQHGRAGGALLLHLPLSRCGRPRPMGDRQGLSRSETGDTETRLTLRLD